MSYLLAHPERVYQLFLQHLALVALSITIGAAIAIPTGIIVSRHNGARSLLLGILGVIYTIPSLALFGLLVPWLGLGFYSALVALVAYSQMMLVRNTILGMNSINPSVIEAAQGMGMSGRQILFRVELPLALPLILSGLRITVVTVIGIASIAAYIDAGGLGTLIFEGIRTDNTSKVLAGTIMLALLAIGSDTLFRMVDLWVRLRPRT
jgi:osmoprotectant transport system permease protein